MARRLRRFLTIGVVLVLLVGAGLAAAMWFVSPGPPQPAKVIRIEGGLIQGVTRDGIANYRGIPYAAPPIGDLRWRAPQPALPWQGTRKADAFKPICMQAGVTLPGMAPEPMSEDCLYLNVWTPAESVGGKRAVMIFSHGGGNSSGSGSTRLYHGDRLAKKNVVIVTYNYRLAGFGTLAHPDLTQESGTNASGNYSLLDDIAALRWVQRNIAAFGGDPDNVTFFGQSAGAYHASQLVVSPLAKDLFRRIIAQSGGAFHPSGTEAGFPRLAQAEKTGVEYAAKFGVDSIAALRRIPAARIVAIDSETRYDDGAPRGPNNLSVDGYVVPNDVYDRHAQGQQADVDLLVGYTADEKQIAHRWAGWTWARLHAGTAKGRVFLYRFSRVPPFRPFSQTKKADHGAELPYVFGYLPSILFYILEAPWNAWRDVRLANTMQTYWTNFAKTGDPNGPGLPVWPDFREAESAMNLDLSIGVMAKPDRQEHEKTDAYIAGLRTQMAPQR